MLQEYYKNASRKKLFFIKAGVLYGAVLTLLYMLFRAYYINYAPNLVVFSVILYLAELHTIIMMFGFLYSLWPRKYKFYDEPNNSNNLRINIFITTAGEPTEIVRDTILHAKEAVQYYNKGVNPLKPARVIVLNDGRGRGKENWREIESICNKEGVLHVARPTNEGFKAGNINNGLKMFPAENPDNTIDCFLDADFCARKYFLNEILKPFKDKTVDFVQSPQRYKNQNTWVALASGAHQIFFFDYVCPAKAYDNALFLCGTNYAIKRSAILAAGGIDNRFVTEDYATSIRLHLQGKKGVFISKVLALGMAPMNLKEYFSQQTRWCKGCLDANAKYFRELFLGKLTLRQKFHYFLSTTYYLIGVRDLILILAPIPYLFWGVSLIRVNIASYLTFIYLPLVVFNFFVFFKTFRNPVKSLVLDVVAFPVFAKAFLGSVFRIKLPFTVTIKKYEKENPFRVYSVQLAVVFILTLGLIYSLLLKNGSNSTGRFINYFWATYDALFLSIGFFLVVRENIRLNISYDLGYFKYLKLLGRVTPALSKIAVIFIIAFVSGFVGPVVYNVVASGTNELLDNHYVRKVAATVNLTNEKKLMVPEHGAYYGYYLSDLNSHPQNPEVSIMSDESPTLALYYQDWAPGSGFDIKFMRAISEKGAVPVLTWEPMDAQNTASELNADGGPQKLILSGVYDEYIRKYARSAKAYHDPFFLRFAHEMNGNWYPWGNFSSESASSYKNMWIHTYNIFVEEGATNVIWTWTPNNTNQYGETEGVMDFYPGDEYVDWTGYSAFNWGTSNEWNEWANFNYISYDIYNELTKLGKPIMVAETSSVSQGGDKTSWFYDTLGTFIPQMDQIKAVVLFNQNYNNADFALDSGMKQYFVLEDNILFNDYYLKSPLFIEQ